MLNDVRQATIFTKLDLYSAYNHVPMKEADEYKLAFWMCYGQFEYYVIPFNVTTTPRPFQSCIDDCLRPYIDNFAVYYLNNILIFWTNEMEHEKHVYHLLQGVMDLSLICKAGKSQFCVLEAGFLGFVNTLDWVGKEIDLISTLMDSTTSKSNRDVPLLLKFICFYRMFIRKYAYLTIPLTELLKMAD